MPTTVSFDVGEDEWVFEDPEGSGDYHVLRCTSGDSDNEHHFRKHPSLHNIGIRHFKGKRAKCHDQAWNYSWDEMVKSRGVKSMYNVPSSKHPPFPPSVPIAFSKHEYA